MGESSPAPATKKKNVELLWFKEREGGIWYPVQRLREEDLTGEMKRQRNEKLIKMKKEPDENLNNETNDDAFVVQYCTPGEFQVLGKRDNFRKNVDVKERQLLLFLKESISYMKNCSSSRNQSQLKKNLLDYKHAVLFLRPLPDLSPIISLFKKAIPHQFEGGMGGEGNNEPIPSTSQAAAGSNSPNSPTIVAPSRTYRCFYCPFTSIRSSITMTHMKYFHDKKGRSTAGPSGSQESATSTTQKEVRGFNADADKTPQEVEPRLASVVDRMGLGYFSVPPTQALRNDYWERLFREMDREVRQRRIEDMEMHMRHREEKKLIAVKEARIREKEASIRELEKRICEERRTRAVKTHIPEITGIREVDQEVSFAEKERQLRELRMREQEMKMRFRELEKRIGEDETKIREVEKCTMEMETRVVTGEERMHEVDKRISGETRVLEEVISNPRSGIKEPGQRTDTVDKEAIQIAHREEEGRTRENEMSIPEKMDICEEKEIRTGEKCAHFGDKETGVSEVNKARLDEKEESIQVDELDPNQQDGGVNLSGKDLQDGVILEVHSFEIDPQSLEVLLPGDLSPEVRDAILHMEP